MTAMCATFFFWVRSLRAADETNGDDASIGTYVYGVLTGLAYIYMVMTWGGFVFVLNIIGKAVSQHSP